VIKEQARIERVPDVLSVILWIAPADYRDPFDTGLFFDRPALTPPPKLKIVHLKLCAHG